MLIGNIFMSGVSKGSFHLLIHPHYRLFCIIVLAFSGCNANIKKNPTQYYYCYNYPDRMVWNDEILVVEGKKGNRSLFPKTDIIKGNQDGFSYRNYDERGQVTHVYALNDHGYGYFDGWYDIIQINLFTRPVQYFRALGVHTTYKKFKEKKPGQTVSQWNLNPKLIKYLPERPPDKDISYAFIKEKLPCKELGYMSYIMHTIKLLVFSIGA